jgi:hypothetical protein
MAKRRRGNAVLAGVGEGMGNASNVLLRQVLQDRGADRTDARTRETQKLLLGRQQQMAETNAVLGLLQEAMKDNNLDPDQLDAFISMLDTSEEGATPEASTRRRATLDRLVPARRRLEGTIGKAIGDAASPEAVPSDQDVIGMAAARGVALPPAWSEGMIPADNDPFANSPIEVRELGERAGVRRRALREKPTETVTGTNDLGAEFTQMLSPYALQEPFATSPTSARQGALEGEKTIGKITTSGQVEADQAGKVAGATAKATQDVEMAPGAVDARVKEAGRKSAATTAAEINTRIANGQKLIDFETKKALAAMQLVGNETEHREWGKQIGEARAAASSALPVLGQLRALWETAQPEIEQMMKGSPAGELTAQIAQGIIPRGVLPTNVRKYLDLLEAARPRLARAMGNVGNFTEGEQTRAGFVAPDFLDAANGGATGYDKLDRIEKLFLAAPSIAQRQKPGSKPITAEEIDGLINSFSRAQSGDVELPAPAPEYDILLTPGGSSVRRPGGRQ